MKKHIFWGIPEWSGFQNHSGLSSGIPEPFWNAPQYVLFHIFYIAGLIIETITFTHIHGASKYMESENLTTFIIRPPGTVD